MEKFNRNPAGWFEIPVTDMQRAIRFYEKVFDIKMSHHILEVLEMAWFPEVMNGQGAAGSLVMHKDFYRPSADGILIYLTAPSGDLSNELSRVEKAGGKIRVPKKLITDEFGYIAVFIDSEGNRIGIHSWD
jgi:predicted enzyme related to lactoylglutathione lyase